MSPTYHNNFKCYAVALAWKVHNTNIVLMTPSTWLALEYGPTIFI